MDITGKSIGKGWKVAYHYDEEQEYHGGYFYGYVNDQNQVSGDNVIFVYPDFDTALIGQFINQTMIKAQEAKIIAYKCQNGLIDIKTKIKTKSPIFKYDPATDIKISENVSIIIMICFSKYSIMFINILAYSSRSNAKKKHLFKRRSFWRYFICQKRLFKRRSYNIL